MTRLPNRNISMHFSTLSRAALCTLLAALAACNGASDNSASSVATATGATSSSGMTSVANTSSTGATLVALSSSSYTVAATSTKALITVNRIGGPSGTATVGYTTVSGTATAGADYSPTSGWLIWSDGDTSPKTIDVPVFGKIAHGKSFSISLTSVAGAASFGE